MYADSSHRVVTLNVLAAICQRASGWSHKFAIERTTANRVYVSYSNPNEYGSARPMVAAFPAYPSGEPENPSVVLDFVSISNDREDIGDQLFTPITDCPKLWRSHDALTWATTLDNLAANAGVSRFVYLDAALQHAALFLGYAKFSGRSIADWRTGAQLADAPYADGEAAVASATRERRRAL